MRVAPNEKRRELLPASAFLSQVGETYFSASVITVV